MLSEISQTQKAKYFIFFSFVGSKPKMLVDMDVKENCLGGSTGGRGGRSGYCRVKTA
jgi:hypothetical protein